MKRIYPWLIVLAGMIGAILRGTQLCYGYEESGLPKDGYWMLPALTIAVLIVCVIGSRVYRESLPFELAFSASVLQRAVGIGCGVLTGAVGVTGVLTVSEQLEEELLLSYGMAQPSTMIGAAYAFQWILCIVTGVAIVYIALGQNGTARGKGYAVCTVLPMFWAGITMIMIYHTNSGNPVRTQFIYELLLCAAVMAGFYAIAGFFYSDGKYARFMMYAGMTGYLGLTVMGGRCYVWLFGSNQGNLAEGWQQEALGLCALFLLMQLFSLSSRQQKA